MTTRTETKPWDFSHVLDLVNSLSTQDLSSSEQHHESIAGSPPSYAAAKSPNFANNIATRDFGTPTKLGDFGKIWQFLGTPGDSPTPAVPPLTSEPRMVVGDLPSKLDYTSDGATYVKPSAKAKEVTFADEASAEDPVTDTLSDRSASPQTPTLTKTQRKKQRRKERRAQEAAEALKSATVSESEADSISKKTPARKASAHVPASEQSKREASSHAVAAPTLQPSLELATARVAEKLAELKRGPQAGNTKSAGPRPQPPAPTTRQHSQPAMNIQPTHVSNQPFSQQWPVTPAKAKAMHLLPATVQPPRQATANFIANQAAVAYNQNTPPMSKPKHVIEPKIVRSGEDRHWALLMKLIGDFWEDRKHLIAPMNLTTHNNNPSGIHVFVDASNIFIGFNDQLKRSRGIPPYVQVPHADLSFDGLALLMERRRPVAKRVLVGSTPHLPAFDKANAVGYECSILEKVYKARELTERQIFFKDHNRFGQPFKRPAAKAPAANGVLSTSPTNNGSPNNANGSGSGGDSETGTTPQYAPARMIEQGVDEILHLKILESVVDSEEPSTIVLATGDAAQAEYSAGFMAMAERALKKGWKVELVSWSKNISMSYTKREWAQTWGERFRVVYLDDYAEELLEM